MRRFFLFVLLFAAPALYYAQGGASAPVARNVVLTTQEGVAKSGVLSATDANGDALTFSIISAPAKGTLAITDTTTGAFTYTPNVGTVGYDTFTFRASDGAGSSTATGAVFIVAASPQWPGQTVRASVAPDGNQLNAPSTWGAMPSADGRFIAFASGTIDEATLNFDAHVYVYDRQTGQTTLASKATGSEQSVGGVLPSITPDGRYVGFMTLTSRVPGGDPNAVIDVFVHDRQTGETTRVNVASDGTPGNGESGLLVLSADGRYAAFYSRSTNFNAADTDDDGDVYLRDRLTGQTTLVGVNTAGQKGNSGSFTPTISADGRYIAFWSESTNLVAGDTNGHVDLFVRDVWTGQTTRVSVGSGGVQLNAPSGGMLSADGRFVVFDSAASNAVPGDTNGALDVFVHDRQSGQTARLSVSSAGTQGNGDSGSPTISADGRYVAFRSAAPNLVPGDTNGLIDEFVHDRMTGQTVRVNVASDGTQANNFSTGDPDDGCCIGAAISADGRSVVIASLASNLVAGDTNSVDDVFVVGPVLVGPTTVNVQASGGPRSVNVSFDYPGTPWTATTTTPWITLTPPIGGSANGTVSFTVAPNTGAARTGTIVAALQTITVNQGPPTFPVAQDSAISTPEDITVSSTLVASDGDGDAVTFSVLTPPALGVVTITNPSTGAFVYSPTTNFNGTDIFTFRARDGTTVSNTGTVSVSITPVNDAPLATGVELAATEDVFAIGTLVATDVDGDALTFSIDTPPSNGAVTINATTGAYLYQPAANFTGSDSFTFRAADASLSSNIATVAIEVAPAGPPAPASFRTIGDLPGGPLVSAVRDAVKVGGVTYAVGASAANNQVECIAPNNPLGCVPQFNTDTPVLWTWNGSTATLTPLPSLVTPTPVAVNGVTASAITPDASYIASAARSNAANPAQALAVRVTRNGLINLNISTPPFPPLPQPASAQAISADGSILYSTAGSTPPRASRVDVNASSNTVIPLLLAAHTGNAVAPRGASFDGSVMVGTSFTAPFTGTNGRAFRYVHTSPVGAVSAIPLLAGGTWNKALALSPDGRMTLVGGNSTFLPNGQVYLHDAITGVTTPLGSPNTPWTPANLAGMTADGSVVVATFVDGADPNGTRHAYVHNAHGWFHLTTILAAAGIDLAAGGWRVPGMQVNGISPDGTLVFGSIRRDDETDATEGFVAELPPGYLAQFDLPAVPPTDTSIVGVWTDTGGSSRDLGVFLADGTYVLIDTSRGTQPAAEYTSGFERGRYYWNATTGAFSIATLQDTNGSVGFSGGNGLVGATVTVSGNTLVLGGDLILTRVTGAAGTVVGGWVMGDPRVENSSAVLVLFADGNFVFAEDGNSSADPLGRDGIEAGTYSWGANGSFTATVTLDTNGQWGFGNGPGTGGTTTLQLSPDSLRLGEPGEPNQAVRIVDPQAVVPVITSPLAAAGTVGSPFAYTITATHASSFGATNLPNGLSMDTATGLISGTPTALGTFVVTISASNSLNGTTTASLTITVVAPTGLTVANASGSFGGTTTLTATLMSGGSPLAGQQVSFSLNGSSAGTATTNGSGVATLTGVSLAGVGAGTYPTGVQATFAGTATHAPASGAATLTVARAIPVIAWPAPATIVHGTPLSATQLNATANVPGTFVYTPPSGTVLPVGAGQTLSVMFTPTDGANFATVQAQVTITVLNAAPAARSVVVTTQEGVTTSGMLLASDVESDPLTFSIVTQPTKGTLTLVNASTGAFTYAPNAGVIGYDSFTFRAAEAGGASSTATGSIFIVATSPRRPGQIVRASIASDGVGGTGSAGGSSGLSADGRFVTFYSASPNVVPGDTNGRTDIFVRDRQTGQTVRVSVASDGTQGNDNSTGPVLSADGRFVAFYSLASNLVAGDTNGTLDAFVHDRQTGQTVRVSVASNGAQGNGDSSSPALSADGRFVAFASSASNLVAGDTNGTFDAFVHDRLTGQTSRVSVASNGAQGNGGGTLPFLSADGRFVAFESAASDLVAGDTNGFPDVFVHDRQTGQTVRVSVASNGAQGNSASNGAALSADGRFVSFRSASLNLVAGDTNNSNDVFVHDRQTGQTVRVSVASNGTQGNAFSRTSALSADGRFVAFESDASNLVPGDTNQDTDTFVHDRQTGQTIRISLASTGAEPDWPSFLAGLSADGRFVAFASEAGNLVVGDNTFNPDVFVVGGGASVNPTVVNVPQEGGTRSVDVTLDFSAPWTATTTTPWITLNPPVSGSTSGTFSFTVAANPGAARTGTIAVAQQTVTVNQAPTTTPIAQNSAVTTGEDTPVSGTLAATDPNGDAITFSVVSPPAHGAVVVTNTSTGAFTYTPALNFNGADSFTFTATAGGEVSNAATVAVTVTPVNDSPVATNGTLAAVEDTIATGALSATDMEGGALIFSIVTPPSHGAVTITNAATGAYAYTPASNYNGADSFTFRASDAGLNSNIATVTISVAGVADAPVALSVVVTTQEGVTKSGTLPAIDAESDPLTFSILTPPTKGTLTLVNPSTGAFTYAPNAGAIGYDSFTFRAAESGGASSTATGSVFIVAASPRWPGQTVRASVASNGSEQNGASNLGAMPSADGRFIVFASGATNLAPGIPAGSFNVFVHDRQTGQTSLVSKASGSEQPIGGALPRLTPDGRYVGFATLASSLPGGNPNAEFDAVVHDRLTGETARVSVASDGTAGDGFSILPMLSADGRYVTFYGTATNLVAGNTDGGEDVYLHDRQTGQTTLVSVNSAGQQGDNGSWAPSISADGRFIAFQSEASNLVSNDTNGAIDVFVRDLWTGQTTRASVASGGGQGNSSSQGAISPDGRHVVFASTASNLVAGDTNSRGDVFVRDLQTGQTTRVSLSSAGGQGDGSSEDATISADGRYVAFRSIASNMVPGDSNGQWDEFVHDRLTGQTVRINVASNGTQANAASTGDDDGCCITPAISADGRSIVITSLASTLVADDNNNADDVFVVGPVLVTPTTVSVSSAAGTHSVNVSVDYPGPWTATTTTPWITLNPPVGGSGSGNVSFTVAANPGAARAGTIVVTLQTVTVTQGPSTAPVAQNGSFTTPEDTPFSGTLVASDPNGDALTFSIVTQPLRGTVVITNPATGAFTYTPSANQFGADSLTFQATAAGEASNVASVSLTVTPVNDAPVANDGTFAAIEDTTTTGVLTATDVEGDALTFTVVSAPAHGVVIITNPTTGAYSYTPAAEYLGPDSFTFRAADAGSSSNIATVRLTSITPVNDAPVATSVVISTQEAVPQSGTLLGSDIDGPMLTFSIVTAPAKGTLALVNPITGAFTYTPHVGALGYDTFTFQVADGAGGSSSATGMVFIVAGSPRWPGQTIRASVSSSGAQGNGQSVGSVLSPDGRFIAFQSDASNLVAGDTNGALDVFVRDRETGQTTRVSVASDGAQAIGASGSPALSADGRYVTFISIAANLVAADTGSRTDVFVHDRQTGQTERVSVASDGSQANGDSVGTPPISADGRFVAFMSNASNLVANDTGGITDVFVRDRWTGQTSRVSVSSSGVQGNNASDQPSISADGRYVAFRSLASNLASGDTDQAHDVFVHDRQTGETTLVSTNNILQESSSLPVLSPDGRLVVFNAFTTQGQILGFNAFVYDRQSGVAQQIRVGSTTDFKPSLSADGRYISFASTLATTLVPDDTNGSVDAFVYDRQTGLTRRVSVGGAGEQGINGGISSFLSADARFVAFDSASSNLVPADTNGAADAFVVGGVSVSPTTVSVSGSGGTHSVNVAVDYPGPWTATTTTPWITMNPPAGGAASGTVTFTVAPNPGAARTGTVVVAAQTVTVNQGPSTAPVAQNGSFATPEDTPFSGTLVATDPNGDALTFSIVTPPVRGGVVITNPSTGAFTYTPAVNVFGGDSFTLQVSGAGGLSNIATVIVDVTPVNDAPSAFESALAVTEDTPASGVFSTVDSDSLLTTIQIVTPPTHGTVTVPNPVGGALAGVSYTYTPSSNYNGPDSFTFRAVDGSVSSNIASIAVSVAPVNDAPVAADVFLIVQSNASRSGLLLASNVEGEALTYVVDVAPVKGTVTITDPSTGAYTYWPDAADGFGYDTFVIRAIDSGGAAATVHGTVFIVASTPKWPGQTVRASVSSSGSGGNLRTFSPRPSADGRFVAFWSMASNLVPGDTNAAADVFVHDRQTGQTTRVSVATGGAQGNSDSDSAAVSADGRFVAFNSAASNLVAGDTNGVVDAFVHDRQTGQTTRVSVTSSGVQGNANSLRPNISADGRYVVLDSVASNLVPGDTNGTLDVFVHDRQTGQTTRVSVASNGAQGAGSSVGASISADGRYVGYGSLATLVSGDTNNTDDVFVHDRQTGQTTRVSVATGGGQSNERSGSPSLSADGHYVTFSSFASNLVPGDTTGGTSADVFVHDRLTGQTTRINVASDGTPGNLGAGSPSITADGRYVAFDSFASNLVPGDTNGSGDVFVHDRQTGQTTRASVANNGLQGNQSSGGPALSADGRFVAFSSDASLLVASDFNGATDAFVAGGVSVSPTTIGVGAAGGANSVAASFAFPGTPWSATTTTPWITINPPSGGSANGSAIFTVGSNVGAARTGTVDVALQTVTVTQAAYVDVTPPTVTPPAAITVYATMPTGATQALVPALAQFLLGATAVDETAAAPVQQPPQLNGAVIVPTTVFALGANAVTFSFTDAAGNVGTANSVVVVIGGGQPSLSVALVGPIAAAGQQNATLRVTNNGTANALNLNIALSSTRTLVGTGTVTLVTGLPATIPLLAPGQSSDISIVLNVPTTVRRFALSETLTMTNHLGGSLSTTPVQTVFPTDVTGPTITIGPTVASGALTSTSMTITWQTNEGATSRVFWGVGTSTNRSTTEDSVYKTSHSVTLTGLLPNTLYSYIVYGHDQAGNFYQSSRREVRTLP